MSEFRFDSAAPVQAWTAMGFPEPRGELIDRIRHALNWAQSVASDTTYSSAPSVRYWDIRNASHQWMLPSSPGLILCMAESRLGGLPLQNRVEVEGEAETLDSLCEDYCKTLLIPLVGYAIMHHLGRLDDAKASAAATRTARQVRDRRKVTITTFWMRHERTI